MAGIPKWNPPWTVGSKNEIIIDLVGSDDGKKEEKELPPSPAELEQSLDEIRKRQTVMKPDGPFPFLIDCYNYMLNNSAEVLEPANSKSHWNRLTIIDGAKFPKEMVLEAVIKAVSPQLLIPALYQTDGDDSFFLFREGTIIKRLIEKNGLRIQDTGLEKPLQINFMVQYVSVDDEPLDPSKVIGTVVDRRSHYDHDGVTLDLRNFKNDSDFKNLYVSLKSLRMVQIIVNRVKKSFGNVLHALILSYNELDRLDLLDFFVGSGMAVFTLDLRHNKITYSGFERSAKSLLNVKSIFIEDNPICEDYETPGEMMYEIKKMAPNLRLLDGVELDFVLDTRASFKFYTRNPGYANFVDHFFHHYYKSLEDDKEKLVQMYDNQACLTFTVCQNDRTPLPGSFFTSSNRNLISMSNITKTYENAFIGKTRIFDALLLMPKMKFDPYSFRIDFPLSAVMQQPGTVMINCTGAFSLPDEPSRQIYTFGRVCILRLDSNVGDWKITNDMWTWMNALPPTYTKCFKVQKLPVKKDFAVMLNPLTKDKDVLVRVVSDLTHMKSAWVEKYLSDSGWDLECTLLSFIDHFKSQLIPHEAFLPFTAST